MPAQKSLEAHPVPRRIEAVLLTRERIQQTLDAAAERGRITRSDANEIVSELVRRGRRQTGALAP